jgi:predicted dehydrogenase
MTAQRTITIGLIGAGMVGQLAHLANFTSLPGCRVAALAELRPDLAQAAATRFGVPKIYPSHRELLQDPEIEAVVVVTRRPATGPIVLDALSSGRHVLSEKPMAHTVAQGEKLVEAAELAGLTYAVGFMKRHDAGVQQAKLLLDEARADGRWGRLLTVRCHCHGGDFAAGAQLEGAHVMTPEPRPDGLELWPVAPDWLPASLAEDYAWFLNVFVHDLNILRWLFGAMPEVVAADLRRRNGRTVLLDFGDFPAVLDMAETSGPDWSEGVEATFERATLRIAFPPPLLRNVPARITLRHAGSTTTIHPPPDGWSWSFRRQAEAFVTDIRERRTPLASGRDGLEDLRLAEAIWRLSGSLL